MVGASVAAGHVVGGDARVVLADVRELRDPGHVADRPDVLGGAQPAVDRDPARRDRQPEPVEPVDVRLAAGRDEQPLEFDPVPIAE